MSLIHFQRLHPPFMACSKHPDNVEHYPPLCQSVAIAPDISPPIPVEQVYHTGFCFSRDHCCFTPRFTRVDLYCILRVISPFFIEGKSPFINWLRLTNSDAPTATTETSFWLSRSSDSRTHFAISSPATERLPEARFPSPFRPHGEKQSQEVPMRSQAGMPDLLCPKKKVHHLAAHNP